MSVCLSVCLLFSHDISKTDAARTTKRDTDMVHHESWITFYFWIKRSKVKVSMHKKQVCVCFRRNAIWTLAAYLSYADFSTQLPTAGFPCVQF